jgi:glycosyltransferase involved in cell wall biosynthesis
MISVIIPVYNGESTIEETLNSLKKQSFKNFECIIIDDHSEDKSWIKIESIIANDKRFKLLKNNGIKGVSSARNTGILASNGDYLIFVDSDDIISSNFLLQSYNRIKLNPNLKVIVPVVEEFGTREKKWQVKENIDLKELLKRNPFPITMLFKRPEKNILFHPSMNLGNEDWDYWIKFFSTDLRGPLPYKSLPTITYFYRKSESTRSATLKQSTNRIEKMKFQMIVNNYELYYHFYGLNFAEIFEPGIKKTALKIYQLIKAKFS